MVSIDFTLNILCGLNINNIFGELEVFDYLNSKNLLHFDLKFVRYKLNPELKFENKKAHLKLVFSIFGVSNLLRNN